MSTLCSWLFMGLGINSVLHVCTFPTQHFPNSTFAVLTIILLRMVTDTQRGTQFSPWKEACFLGPWLLGQKPLPLRCGSALGLHSILNPGFAELGICRTSCFQSLTSSPQARGFEVLGKSLQARTSLVRKDAQIPRGRPRPLGP